MIQSDKQFVETLLNSLLWCWLFVIASIVLASYLGYSFTEAISFHVDDGWCPIGKSALGAHCFGDFGHPYLRGGFNDVYVNGNQVVLNSPFVLLIFEVLRLFPYRVILALFLSAAAIAMVYPVFAASRHFSGISRSAAIFTCGVGSLGFLSAIDRANPVVFVPLIAYQLVLMVDRGDWTRGAVLLAFGSAIKFWFPLLVLPFLLQRKFRHVLLSASLALMLHLIPLALFPGNYLANLQMSLRAIFSNDFQKLFQPYAISIVAFIRRIGCAIRDRGTCNTLSTDWGLESTTAIGVVVASLLILWASICYLRFPPKNVMRYAPLLSLGAVAVPTAQTYNSVMFITIAALVILWDSEHSEASTSWSLRLVLCSTLPPFAIFFVGNSVFSSTNGSDPGPMFRLHYYLIPVIVLIWITHSLAIVYQQRNCSKFVGTTERLKHRKGLPL